ncbi:GNAT family N-acetyltransferase [Allobranchiibius sp. CTAmp26]|uniref:GNAT family N-acetyltransferase n=1 Tax=Allobranchiibius sp. CTAmp26 TaxID=2815214 RepID=UPI0027DDEAB5|nr:GNAT family N-acetyltransferase [Allobranchiibius sp. CTAmp26]
MCIRRSLGDTLTGVVASVVLRPWMLSDAPALRAAWASNPDLSTQFGEAVLDTDLQAEEYLQSSLGFAESARNWAIVEDGVAVGNVGLAAIEWRHATAWAYYWVAASARGRGYATGALSAVADHAFSDGLERLELGHRVNNPASCRVAVGAGFLAEGVERQKLRYGTERFDVELHARLCTDPAPQHARLRLPMLT